MRGKLVLISLLVCSTLRAETIVSGDVQGIWNASGNPFKVEGNVTVPSGQFLTISQGVEIRFMGNYKFTVNGGLTARGTINDSVKFIYNFGITPGAWQYIDFTQSAWGDSTLLRYCLLQSGERAVQATNCSVTLDHCLIKGHSLSPVRAVDNAQLFMYSTTVTNNGGSGITMQNSTAEINDCSITYNSGTTGRGINASQGGALTINGGYIAHNPGTGVYCEGPMGDVNVIGTEIAFNGDHGIGLVNCDGLHGSRAVIHDNALHGIFLSFTPLDAHNLTISTNHGDGIFFSGASLIMELSSSIIDHNGDWGIFSQNGNAYDFLSYNDAYLNIDGSYSGCDSGNGSIAANPQYVSYGAQDYHLTEFSPCIDTGRPQDPLDPDNTVTDMGAFYFNQSPVGPGEIPITPSACKIVSAFPNPFNPVITLHISSPIPVSGVLEVWDAGGRLVGQVWQGRLSSGLNTLNWDAGNKPSGAYFLRFRAGRYNDLIRCVLLK